MADKTQLNRNLSNGNATVINRCIAPIQEHSSGSATVLNSQVSANGIIVKGTLLCGKHRVVEKMSITTGEADMSVNPSTPTNPPFKGI